MSDFWENELVEIAAYYSVAVLCLVLFLTVFELVTAYKNWEEDFLQARKKRSWASVLHRQRKSCSKIV